MVLTNIDVLYIYIDYVYKELNELLKHELGFRIGVHFTFPSLGRAVKAVAMLNFFSRNLLKEHA